MIVALPGPCDWINAALQVLAQDQQAVLALVCGKHGSTPRGTGSWVLLNEQQILGSVGGGELEHTMIEAGQAMLAGNGDWSRSIMHCVLGSDMRQCCGGTMEVMLQPIDSGDRGWLQDAQASLYRQDASRVAFDRVDSNVPPLVIVGSSPNPVVNENMFVLTLADPRPALAVFGAGHVGRALCTIASQLPLRLTVFDQRPDQCALIPDSGNIEIDTALSPLHGARELTNHDAALIMTHSHALDYELCRILLRQSALCYTGLIGSKSKAQRFRKVLKKDGLSDSQIAHLTSPIGVDGPVGKEPGMIALGVLGEILNTPRLAAQKAG